MYLYHCSVYYMFSSLLVLLKVMIQCLRHACPQVCVGDILFQRRLVNYDFTVVVDDNTDHYNLPCKNVFVPR